MIFTLLAGLELVEMYSFVLANKSLGFLYTFPISNSILLTWVGWGGQGGGAIGIKIGAQVANQVATRGGGRPAVVNWFQVLRRVLFLDTWTIF